MPRTVDLSIVTCSYIPRFLTDHNVPINWMIYQFTVAETIATLTCSKQYRLYQRIVAIEVFNVAWSSCETQHDRRQSIVETPMYMFVSSPKQRLSDRMNFHRQKGRGHH